MLEKRNKSGMSTIVVVTDVLTELGVNFFRDNIIKFPNENDAVGVSLIYVGGVINPTKIIEFDNDGFFIGFQEVKQDLLQVE